ncbi:MAG: cytochrome P450 [Mycolicibacterium cosmeticum]|nr:cytochrome P450 [Mycolicibacterium cosmeticum]
MVHAHGRRRPPGPSLARLGMIVAGELPDPTYTLLPEIARRYGDVADIPVPGRTTMTLVSHPDHVDHVMTRHHSRYRKHESIRELFFDQPPPLPLLVGEEWKRTRRALNPHFGEQGLTAAGAHLTAGITERVAAWDGHAGPGRGVDLQDALAVVVTDGLMRSMFTTALSTTELTRFVDATRDYARFAMVRTATYLLPGFLPRPLRRRGEAAKSYIFGALDELIERRSSAGPQAHPDVLDVLLSMPLEYPQLRSELFDLVLAGVDTTSGALAWSVGLLFADQQALVRARAEVDALGAMPLQFQHLGELQYLRCCFDEGQRIQAATPANIRTATEDDEIGGYVIPAGSHVLISPYGLHRDARFWTEPGTFRPSRFLDDQINRNAYVPFNIGPRKCMGYRLANAAAVLTMAAILQRYEVSLPTGWRPRHELRGATGLAGGLPVTLSMR